MPSEEYETSPSEVRKFVIVQLVLTGLFLTLLFFMLGGSDADYPPAWLAVLLVVLVGVGTFVSERVWLGAAPLPADADPADNQREAVGIFASQTVRKLAYCEAPLLVSVVVAFVGDYGGWPIVIAGFPGLLALAFETWPTPRNTSLTAAMLDSRGASSQLVESFMD